MPDLTTECHKCLSHMRLDGQLWKCPKCGTRIAATGVSPTTIVEGDVPIEDRSIVELTDVEISKFNTEDEDAD